MALLTETNAQYYSGQQSFIAPVPAPFQDFDCTTFNTTLVDTVAGVSNTNYSVTVDGVLATSTVSNNVVTIPAVVGLGAVVVVQLNETALWNNYGEYEYISLDNIVNNFLVAYVGDGKLITKAKRTDVLFHAKRGLQEFKVLNLKN